MTSSSPLRVAIVATALLALAGCANERDSRTLDDAQRRRAVLVELLYGEPRLPNLPPEAIEHDVQVEAFEGTENLDRIDRLEFTLAHDLRSSVLHLLPREGNGRVVIYHMGHFFGPDHESATPTIRMLVEEGYAVLGYSMPLYGPNLPENETLTVRGREFPGIVDHTQLKDIERDLSDVDFFPSFFSALSRGITYVTARYGYRRVDAIGHSGGGWTVTLYAGLDDRITLSIPVAGSIPFSFRTSPAERGDYEQFRARPIYDYARYVDFYYLASAGEGRKQLQVLNERDPCCFWIERHRDRRRDFERYVAEVNARIAHNRVGGAFELYVVEDRDIHEIGDEVIALIRRRLATE